MIGIFLQTEIAATQARETTKAFGEMDPHGFMMAVIAITVVFSSLLLLYIVFKNVARFFLREQKSMEKKGETTSLVKRSSEEIANEEYAAVALALHLYKNQMHDMENAIITIQKATKAYSPWSSKIYGLRRNPKN